MAVDTGSSAIYGINLSGQVWRSDDFGKTWIQGATILHPLHSHPLFVDSRGYVYVNAQGHLMVSRDKGMSFAQASIAFSASNSVLWNLWEMQNGTLVASEYGHPCPPVRSRVYRSRDGLNWVIHADMSKVDTDSMHLHQVFYDHRTDRLYQAVEIRVGMKTYYQEKGVWHYLDDGGYTCAVLVSDGVLMLPDVRWVAKILLDGTRYSIFDLYQYGGQFSVYDGVSVDDVVLFTSSTSGTTLDACGVWASPDAGNTWLELLRFHQRGLNLHICGPINGKAYLIFHQDQKVYEFTFPSRETLLNVRSLQDLRRRNVSSLSAVFTTGTSYLWLGDMALTNVQVNVKNLTMPNLIGANPSFESRDFRGWWQEGWTIVSDKAYHGIYAAHCDAKGGYRSIMSADPFNVVQHKWYLLTYKAWIQTFERNPDGILGVVEQSSAPSIWFYDSTGKVLSWASHYGVAGKNNSWCTVYVQGKSPPNAVKARIKVPALNGVFWVDAVGVYLLGENPLPLSRSNKWSEDFVSFPPAHIYPYETTKDVTLVVNDVAMQVAGPIDGTGVFRKLSGVLTGAVKISLTSMSGLGLVNVTISGDILPDVRRPLAKEYVLCLVATTVVLTAALVFFARALLRQGKAPVEIRPAISPKPSPHPQGCRYCGRELPAEGAYCDRCGAKRSLD